MDRRFAESEAKMNKRFTEFEIKLTQMDKKLDRTKTNLLAEMDKRIAKSENLVLEEMERTRKILEIRIQTVQANLDEVRDYYRVTRLEQDNATLFLRMLTGLEKRVENLEQKSA
jgi:predicted O-methyltransferase YrrM